MNIFLVGITGSGKSTLGKQLAVVLNYSFVDSDQWIEAKSKKKISEIFTEDGEKRFRELEMEFVQFAQTLTNTIVATGAGLPCNNHLMEQLNRMGTTVWLDVAEDIVAERLKNDPTPRPKLKEFKSIQEAIHFLLGQRRKFYKQAKLQIKNPTKESLLQLIQTIR